MPSQRSDLSFGLAKEESNAPRICKHLGTYMMKLPPMHVMDWLECIPTEGEAFYAEQKSRNVSYEYIERSYGGTVMIGKNKVDFLAKQGDGLLYFDLRDVLYWIQYDKELFDTFDVKMDFVRGSRDDCADRSHAVVYIPLKHLNKV
jgi:hypothetical protein